MVVKEGEGEKGAGRGGKWRGGEGKGGVVTRGGEPEWMREILGVRGCVCERER